MAFGNRLINTGGAGPTGSWSVANLSLSYTRAPLGAANYTGIHLKPDGSGFYYVYNNTRTVYGNVLTTLFDVRTASSTLGSIPMDTYTGGLNISDVRMKDDGTKVWVFANSNDTVNDIYEFSLSTPFNLNSRTLISTTSFNYLSRYYQGFYISPDGNYLFTTSRYPSTYVIRYTLTTPFTVSTRVFDKEAYFPGGGSIYFKPDGLRIFTISQNTNSIYQAELSTAWDISTINSDLNRPADRSTGMFINYNGDTLITASSTFDNMSTYTMNP